MTVRNAAGDGEREATHLSERVVPFDAHHHVQAALAAGLDPCGQSEFVEHVAGPQRGLRRGLRIVGWIEIEQQRVGPIRAVDAREPGVELDNAHLGGPPQLTVACYDQVRHVAIRRLGPRGEPVQVGRRVATEVLLKEPGCLDAVGMAFQGDRTTRERRQQPAGPSQVELAQADRAGALVERVMAEDQHRATAGPLAAARGVEVRPRGLASQ